MLPNNNPNSCNPCQRNLLLSHVHTTLKPSPTGNQIMQDGDNIINREIQTGLTGDPLASTITWCTIQNSYDLFHKIQEEQTKPTCIRMLAFFKSPRGPRGPPKALDFN